MSRVSVWTDKRGGQHSTRASMELADAQYDQTDAIMRMEQRQLQAEQQAEFERRQAEKEIREAERQAEQERIREENRQKKEAEAERVVQLSKTHEGRLVLEKEKEEKQYDIYASIVLAGIIAWIICSFLSHFIFFFGTFIAIAFCFYLFFRKRKNMYIDSLLKDKEITVYHHEDVFAKEGCLIEKKTGQQLKCAMVFHVSKSRYYFETYLYGKKIYKTKLSEEKGKEMEKRFRPGNTHQIKL